MTLKKETCSSHSPDWRFCQRRLTATPKLGHAPAGVGEAELGLAGEVADDGDGVVCHGDGPPGLPGRSGGRGRLLAEEAAAGGLVVGQADELVADEVVREPELVLEIGQALAAEELDDDVVALGLLG